MHSTYLSLTLTPTLKLPLALARWEGAIPLALCLALTLTLTLTLALPLPLARWEGAISLALYLPESTKEKVLAPTPNLNPNPPLSPLPLTPIPTPYPLPLPLARCSPPSASGMAAASGPPSA